MIVYGGQERQPITLGGELARGGQGAIHTVAARDDTLAKIYFKPDPLDRDRLLWMIGNPPPRLPAATAHATVAWPQLVLFDAPAEGCFVGYLMPRVRDSVPALNLITPKIRARQLPQFDSKYLHRTARNLAVAVGIVHHSDYVVGDLNESNVLVTADALVTLIDVDSFQTIELRGDQRIIYHCPVGKPEYTAPELQGAVLSHVLRTNEHDGFALAVLVFQLLMGGRHPFQSIWKGRGKAPAIGDKIQRGLFPYAGAHGSLVAPPPQTTLEVLHPALHALMVRCFVNGQSDPLQRPTPDEWETALAEAEEHLVRCRFGHTYSAHLTQCPDCRQKLTERRQPWPRDPVGGRPLFPAGGLRTSQPSAARSMVLTVGTILALLFVGGNVVAAIVNTMMGPRLPATAASVMTVRPVLPATETSVITVSPVLPATATSAITVSPVSPLYTSVETPLYAGPGVGFTELAVLPPLTPVVAAGRLLGPTWLYIIVSSTSQRGWVETSHVTIPRGLESLSIPVFLPLTPLP